MSQADTSSFPNWEICCEHVPLESCMTDDQWQAVQQGCYAAHFSSQKPSPKAS